MKKIFLFLSTATILIIFDSVYLYFFKGYFQKQVKSVQGSDLKLDMTAAVLCYIFLVVGLYYFIIQKRESLMNAFLLGILVYSVYELTNKALLKNWSYYTVVLDTLWGGILFASTAAIVYKFF
jgi:uncharacterized membrane protein